MHNILIFLKSKSLEATLSNEVIIIPNTTEKSWKLCNSVVFNF